MRNSIWLRVAMGLLVAAGVTACGKKEEPAQSGKTAHSEGTTRKTAARPAAEALTPENAPYAAVIAGKGYRVVQAERFPSQVDGRQAMVVVYRAGDAASGGVIYLRAFGPNAPRPAWHWYFTGTAPDSVEAVDANRDGLWDLRVFMAGGAVSDFLQEDSFTFMGAERSGITAQNGASSAPKDLWRAFDSDSTTAWKSPAAGAFIEVPNPLGLEKGELVVRLSDGDRPKKLALLDGGKKVQEFDLEQSSQVQRFLLDDALKGAAAIRVNVEGPGATVAISELEIR